MCSKFNRWEIAAKFSIPSMRNRKSKKFNFPKGPIF